MNPNPTRPDDRETLSALFDDEQARCAVMAGFFETAALSRAMASADGWPATGGRGATN